jgi:hypothetical protein
MLDMLSFGFMGTFALVFTLSLYISYLVKRYIFKSFVFQLVLTFIFSIFIKMFTMYLNDGNYFVISLLVLFSHLGTTSSAAIFYLLNSYVKERFLKHEYKLIK